MPTPSVPDKPETAPQESKYDVCYEEGEMPKSYTIKAGDYPSAIISAMYGVKFGTPEYNAIKKLYTMQANISLIQTSTQATNSLFLM